MISSLFVCAFSTINCIFFVVLFCDYHHLLPDSVSRLMQFGKNRPSSNNGLQSNWTQFLCNLVNTDIPKRWVLLFRKGFAACCVIQSIIELIWSFSWFRHFYVFALICQCLVICAHFGYVSINPDRNCFFWLIWKFLRHSNQDDHGVPFEVITLVLVVLWLQFCRRFYECYFISVFSDAKMNFLHYLSGFAFYTSLIVYQIHLLQSDSSSKLSKLSNQSITCCNRLTLNILYLDILDMARSVIGSSIFLIGSYLEFRTMNVLASLRNCKFRCALDWDQSLTCVY